MNKIVAYIVKCFIPPVRKAIIAAAVPAAPGLVELVRADYGIAAAFIATSVLTAAGVYRARNDVQSADVAGSTVPPAPPSTSPAAA